MQEYEDRQEGDVCGNCKFYEPRSADKGWCKKHPRLAQKHDDPTHRTNWCQYFERTAMSTKKPTPDVEDAEAVDATPHAEALPEFENRDVQSPYPTYGPVEAEAVIRELKMMMGELEGFKDSLGKQLVSAAENDNTTLMLETKGMVRVVKLVVTNIGVRAASLVPTMGKPN